MRTEEASGAAFAATWRDQSGEVVGQTYGGTMCWSPRNGGGLRVETDGYVHVVRCRECPGCMEFERRRLATRLHDQYSSKTMRVRPLPEPSLHNVSVPKRTEGERVFLVRIYAPLDRHAAIAHALHRRPSLDLEPGMYRLGTTSFGVLARDTRAIKRALHTLGLEHRVEPIRLGRGRRAWAPVTAGMSVSRSAYGENVNRFYARGLPRAEKKSWDVIRVKPYQSYDRRSSGRAWTSGNVVLVPPEVWRLGRADRRQVRAMLHDAVSPEAAAIARQRVMELVAQAVRPLPVIAPLRAALTREQVVESYRRMAARAEAARTEVSAADPDPPSSEKGGYATSGHSPPRGEPVPGSAESERAWKEHRKRRSVSEIDEWAERMAKKAKERGRGDS